MGIKNSVNFKVLCLRLPYKKLKFKFDGNSLRYFLIEFLEQIPIICMKDSSVFEMKVPKFLDLTVVVLMVWFWAD
ncbi:MAG: hypothetical protein CL677_09945 [Bdellovibrionaceae bacterium]|nr:hypothetical protein [Pseudobdellovibrionaceae bacterium]